MDKQAIISEIQRVANGANRLSQNDFEAHSNIGLTTIRDTFGTWNQAIEAAGLLPISPGGGPERPERYKVTDDEYLQEIQRLSEELSKEITMSEMNAKGRFSTKPYLDRWGTFTKAREAAYEKLGRPQSKAEDLNSLC